MAQHVAAGNNPQTRLRYAPLARTAREYTNITPPRIRQSTRYPLRCPRMLLIAPCATTAAAITTIRDRRRTQTPWWSPAQRLLASQPGLFADTQRTRRMPYTCSRGVNEHNIGCKQIMDSILSSCSASPWSNVHRTLSCISRTSSHSLNPTARAHVKHHV